MPDKPKMYAWFTETRVTYWLKVALLVLAASYFLGGILSFLGRIESIAVIVIAAIFFAYVLYPAVRTLNRSLPLLASILIVYALLALVVAALISFVVPTVAHQISEIIRAYPGMLKSAQYELYNPHSRWLAMVPDWLRYFVANLPVQSAMWLRAHHYDAAVGALSVVTGTLTAVAAVVIVPVLAAYILLDSESLKRYFVALIPNNRREKSLEVLTELEEVIGGFIRGQILVAISVGVLISLMLFFMHVPYALLIGVAAAVLDVIPYVGAVATFIPAVILAFVNHGAANAIIVAVLFILIFEMEGHFIAPSIVSKTVSLSPLAVLLAILIGGQLMGIVGMFIAVPVAGMLRVLAYHVVPPKASLEEAQPALTEAPRDETELAPVGES
ncbi:MAG: AI-2E family transporter [Vulcanimicrobiaceae bacterium]